MTVRTRPAYQRVPNVPRLVAMCRAFTACPTANEAIRPVLAMHLRVSNSWVARAARTPGACIFACFVLESLAQANRAPGPSRPYVCGAAWGEDTSNLEKELADVLEVTETRPRR